jgi:glyoxylase-like metal-dependent hydrolase (beta-lactamase superfamily II)
MVYLIDDRYLFAGDTICFGADGGYSFIGALAEDNKLSIQSLNRLEMIVKGKQRDIKVITGHTGYTDDLLFAFAHIDKVCSLFSRKVFNPDAPYDGYDESDDTKENTEKSRQNMRRT